MADREIIYVAKDDVDDFKRIWPQYFEREPIVVEEGKIETETDDTWPPFWMGVSLATFFWSYIAMVVILFS